MENTLITNQELENLKKEIESIKSTIEIMQDKETMNEIITSERNRINGKEIAEIQI